MTRACVARRTATRPKCNGIAVRAAERKWYARRMIPMRHPSFIRRSGLGISVVVASVFACANASAQPTVGVDAQMDVPTSPSRVSAGYSGDLRIGYQLRTVLITLTPEVGGGYHVFGGTLAPRILRGFVGGRVGIGAPVHVNAFVHVGYAGVTNDNVPDRQAAAFDGGLALDLLSLWRLSLGVQAAYNVVLKNDDGPANRWLSAGVNAQILF